MVDTPGIHGAGPGEVSRCCHTVSLKHSVWNEAGALRTTAHTRGRSSPALIVTILFDLSLRHCQEGCLGSSDRLDSYLSPFPPPPSAFSPRMLTLYFALCPLSLSSRRVEKIV